MLESRIWLVCKNENCDFIAPKDWYTGQLSEDSQCPQCKTEQALFEERGTDAPESMKLVPGIVINNWEAWKIEVMLKGNLLSTIDELSTVDEEQGRLKISVPIPCSNSAYSEFWIRMLLTGHKSANGGARFDYLDMLFDQPITSLDREREKVSKPNEIRQLVERFNK